MGKRGPEKQFDRMIQTQVSSETYEWIAGLATTLGWSLSATVRLLIDDHIRWLEQTVREHVGQTLDNFEKEMSGE